MYKSELLYKRINISSNRTGAVYVLSCVQDDDELCGSKLLYPIDERKK